MSDASVNPNHHRSSPPASFDEIPLAIEPHYRTANANIPVDLYEGPMLLRAGNTSITGEGFVKLEWTPVPRITFRLNNSDKHPLRFLGAIMGADKVTLTLTDRAAVTNVVITRIDDAIRGVIEEQLILGQSRVARLVFHLANFSAAYGSKIRSADNRSFWAGRASLVAGEWKICIDSIHNFRELTDDLERVGGYGITHAGVIERIDGSDFDVGDAETILTVLEQLLSFSASRWVTPIRIPRGLSEQDYS